MSYARLAQRLYNTPLLITADKLDVLAHVLRAYEDGRPKLLAPYEKKARPELAAGSSPQLTQSGYVRYPNGVSVVQILDTLVQRTSGMDAESGLTSYAEIGNQVANAMHDPLTRGILLEVDSPGGEVNGIFDLAAEIRAAGAGKPIFAHVNEEGYSGGYVLASAAESIYTTRTGMVGSIGVRMRHVDQSAYDAKRGLVYTDIVAGERKAEMSPNAPLSDSARQFMQDHVDRLYGFFVQHVADMRGVDPQVVRDTQAGMLNSDQAMAQGFIDGVATIGETMNLLLERIDSTTARTVFFSARAEANASRASQPSADAEKEPQMTDQEKAAQAAAIAEARAAGVTEGKTQATAEATAAALAEAQTKAAAAAQTRIAAILTHGEAQERRTLAEHLAFKTGMSAEDAAALLAASPKEVTAAAANNLAAPANLLAAAMSKIPNPQVGADATEGEETVESLAASIVNAGKRKPLVIAK